MVVPSPFVAECYCGFWSQDPSSPGERLLAVIYANASVYPSGSRLLSLHLLFIYLQGDSLQTKQVIKRVREREGFRSPVNVAFYNGERHI